MLAVWLLCASGAAGQGAGMARMELQRGENGSMLVSYSCRWQGETDTCRGYVTLRIDGMNSTQGAEGAPKLPTMSRLITVPRGVLLTLTEASISNATSTILPESVLLEPATAARAKVDVPPLPLPDKAVYTTDSFYRPCPPAMLEHLGTMDESEVYRLTVAPVAYNPVRGEVRVESGEVRVESGEWRVENLADADCVAPLSTFHFPLSTFILVAPTMFREGLQRFADWKRQEGYNVEEIYIETTDRDSIKGLMSGAWSVERGAWSHILLVGDAGLIPPFPGTSIPEGFTSHKTDLYYAEFTGDYLPDALLGRWPVNDTAELRLVVDKTLRYEQGADLDTSLLRRALLVAGMESQQPAPVTTNGQVNYVGQLLGAMDTLCWRNPASDTLRSDILQHIGEGAALVNYTAHCTAGGWSHPAVTYASIDTLGESQPAFYINNCCKSNAFDADGFGEQLLRKGVGGAVGVIGATNSTLWNEDYYWSVGPKYPFSLYPEQDSLLPGAFDAWINDHRQLTTTAGDILAAGNMAVTAFGSPYDKFYWEIYCLLGDPTLRPRLGAPQMMWLALTDTVRVGATQIVVAATPRATVTAVQGHRLLGVGVAGDDSIATLQLALPADTLPLTLTATAPQAVAATDTVVPLAPHGRAVSFRNMAAGDTAVDFMLANIGSDTVFNLAVSLLPDSADAMFVATVNLVDTLLPHAEMPMHTTINVTRWAPQWSGTLEAGDADGMTLCSLCVGHTLEAPPTLTFALLNTDSTTATAVLPNTEYLLAVTVVGEYDSVMLCAESGEWRVENWEYAAACSPLSTLHSPLTLHLVTPDSLTHLRLAARVTRESYSRDYEYWLTAGRRNENFENGFDCHPWNLDTPRPWTVDSSERHGGTYSLRSAPIDYRQTTDLLLDVLLPSEDSVVFWVKTSSEEGCDKLVFSVDGLHRGSWSGNMDWRRRAYAIAAGRHTLRWRYFKDESGNAGSDCGWLDDLRLPLALWDSAYGCIDTAAEPEPPTAATEAEAEKQQPRLFPNPTARWLNIDAAGELTLTDIYGRTVFTAATDIGTALDLAPLPTAIYLVTISCGGAVHHYKILKK